MEAMELGKMRFLNYSPKINNHIKQELIISWFDLDEMIFNRKVIKRKNGQRKIINY